MPKNKPLNFEGATLESGGGSIRNGVYEKNFWRVELADGTIIQRHLYDRRDDLQFSWERWWPNTNKQYRWDRDGSFRLLGPFDNNAVDHWVKSHPEYFKDGTRRYEES